jgi:hypothetical protein
LAIRVFTLSLKIMKKRLYQGILLAASFWIGAQAGRTLWAKSRSAGGGDGFPDYNRLEFAKPLPPADQQVPERKPGSIDLEVGKGAPAVTVPLDAVPMPLTHQAPGLDETEPPMIGIIEDTAAATASSATVTPAARATATPAASSATITPK